MAKIGGGIIVLLFSLAGVVFAFIEKTLYGESVGVTALSNMGVTLTEAMTITIVTFMLLGTIVGLLRG